MGDSVHSDAVRQPLDIRRSIDARFYPEFGDNWDDTAFRKQILRYLKPEHSVLDLGAGAGIVPQMNFRGLARQVAGLDPDPRVADNPYLDSAMVGYAERLPYDSGSFDLVFADNVLEHLPDPLTMLNEVKRVLRPGGHFLAKTPNRRHYVPTLARSTPHWFHRFVNRLRGRDEEDTFPTLYRANSAAHLGSLATHAGLPLVELRAIEGRPEYLRCLWPLYLMGIIYERVVNRWEALAGWRVVLIAVFQKEGL